MIITLKIIIMSPERKGRNNAHKTLFINIWMIDP